MTLSKASRSAAIADCVVVRMDIFVASVQLVQKVPHLCSSETLGYTLVSKSSIVNQDWA